MVNKVYPHHLNKVIAASDADFSHEGNKSISGVAIMMNGGAIFHFSRRHTYVSMTSTEAEVKAASLLVHHLEYAISPWSGLAGSKHGTVWCISTSDQADFKWSFISIFSA